MLQVSVPHMLPTSHIRLPSTCDHPLISKEILKLDLSLFCFCVSPGHRKYLTAGKIFRHCLTQNYFRSIHLLRWECSRHRHLQQCVRSSVNTSQLQGGAADHQDCGGRKTLHFALWSSWWLAKTFSLLDDSGKEEKLSNLSTSLNRKSLLTLF